MTESLCIRARGRGGFKEAHFRAAVEAITVQIADSTGNMDEATLPFVESLDVTMILDRGEGGSQQGQDALATVGMST